jgi:putative Mg2+ transporter-C (MgtC) family protein
VAAFRSKETVSAETKCASADMPVTLTIADVCLRILLTALASAVLGFDRSVEGHPAGVKTTMLVALAACLSMVQANWLINTVGKTPNSFVTLDLMRLPLGILTGVGFIGGGAILKKGSDVIGLTTAATLWFVTVIGLCFGGGQIFLGVVGAAIGFAILRGLKRIEQRFRQERPAKLTVKWRQDEIDLPAALATLRIAELELTNFVIRRNPGDGVEELQCSVRRYSLPGDHSVPAEIAGLARHPGILEWEWKD